MAYDPKFFERYKEYLKEETVRVNHDRVFGYFNRLTRPLALRVVDLGCGLGEFSTYGHYEKYVGVDVKNNGLAADFIRADYRDFDFFDFLPFMPTVFVSLFSVECCYSISDKYALYEKIFAEIPSIQYGLTSGFFYEGQRGLDKVGETGGIVSYQTMEDASRHISRLFSEFRIYMRTPSKMFGDDVVEAWKILRRS